MIPFVDISMLRSQPIPFSSNVTQKSNKKTVYVLDTLKLLKKLFERTFSDSLLKISNLFSYPLCLMSITHQ